MERMTIDERGAKWPALGLSLLAGLAAACSGGGGGSGGGGESALGAITSSHLLARVDSDDASMTVRTGPGPAGFAGVWTMAMDPDANVLYALDNTLLLEVKAAGGPKGLDQAPRPIGTLGWPNTPKCMAWDRASKRLFGVVVSGPPLSQNGKLIRIDPQTAEAVEVGPCQPVEDLTYDTLSGMLFALDGPTLFRIDPQTGASTELFQEQSLLPHASGLVADHATGLLYTAYNPPGGTPGIVSISLSGQVQLVSSHERTLGDLVLDSDSGRFYGLTRGMALVELVGGLANPTWRDVGNLGCRPISMSFDPTDGSTFAVNLDTDLAKSLVKLHPSGRMVTVGALGADIGSIAYDPVLDELWGFDNSDRHVVSIDPESAVTTPIQAFTLSAGTQLAIDPVQGDLYAYDDQTGVTLRIDPHTPSWQLLGNNIGVENAGGLEYDPVRGELVAAWDPDPGTGSGADFSIWAPHNSGLAGGALSSTFDVWALGRDSNSGLLFAFDGNAAGLEFEASGAGELFEVDPWTSAKPRSTGSLWNRPYRAAVQVESLGRGFAIDKEWVYSFDLQSGETERVGSVPFSSEATGITWDPVRGMLGFVSESLIRWSYPTSPWAVQDTTLLGGFELDVIAHDPASGLYYGIGAGQVVSIAVNAGSAVVIQVGSVPPGVTPTDVTCRGGELFAATGEQRLFRIDVGTGAWHDVGRSRFRMEALY